MKPHLSNMRIAPADERAVASSDYDSTYDSTYETNHSDSSDFAQNEEEGEGGKKPPEAREGCREYLAEGIVLHPLLPSPEVGWLNLVTLVLTCFKSLQRQQKRKMADQVFLSMSEGGILPMTLQYLKMPFLNAGN